MPLSMPIVGTNVKAAHSEDNDNAAGEGKYLYLARHTSSLNASSHILDISRSSDSSKEPAHILRSYSRVARYHRTFTFSFSPHSFRVSLMWLAPVHEVH